MERTLGQLLLACAALDELERVGIGRRAVDAAAYVPDDVTLRRYHVGNHVS